MASAPGWLGSTIDGTLGDQAQAWLGLAIAVVLLSAAGPAMARAVRYTLLAVILYVALTNADRFAPAITRFNRSLGLEGATGGRVRGGTY